MKQSRVYRLLGLMAYLLCATVAVAQSGFYIPKRGKIFFVGDTATVFSDVTNEGALGIGKKAVVNMAARTWYNHREAEIATDSNGEGGQVRFIDTVRQRLDAGYNAATKYGPVFQHLLLNNAAGLELINSAAKVQQQVDFGRGLFYLNGQSLSLANNGSGGLLGYDSSRYFVTGAGLGLFIREAVTVDDGWVVFPVGSEAHKYTPAALRSLSGNDDFFVTAMDSVRDWVTGSASLMNESVGTSWQIGKRYHPGIGGVEVALQHLNEREGGFFTANKTKAYVSQWDGVRWDVGYPQTHPGMGHLTTSLPLQNSGTNSREFLQSIPYTGYFTKLTGAGDTTKMRLWFNAYRLNRANVNVYWTTQPELNIKYFVVQRRLANETEFKPIDSVDSKAINGFSATALHYSINDPNGYTGVSFYRLMPVAYNGDTTYSQVVAVGNKAGEFESELWPNPSSGRFYVSLNTPQPVKKLIVWDVLGQKVMEVPTNGKRVVQVDAYQLAAANYYVSLIGVFDTILETKKLVIVR